MSTITTTRTRNERGQFVATPKPSAPKPKPAPKAKATTRKVTTRKATVTAAQVEREAKRQAYIESKAAGLTVQQARIALAQAQREVKRIERTGAVGWVKATAKVSTATKVLALVESRQPSKPSKREVAAALAVAIAPATSRGRRSSRRNVTA